MGRNNTQGKKNRAYTYRNCWNYNCSFDRYNCKRFLMVQKTLEKGSVWEKADTNGDGMVTDKEMAIKERMVLLENRDKKEDQQRYLVWFSALTVTIFIVVLMTPVVPIERIDHLSGIAEIWVLSNMGVLASFIGFNQLSKRNGNGEK